jgi:L-ascorbate metabolism protein UlaG (beta-lactamase superfamily)
MVLIDPFDASTGLKIPRQNADLVLTTSNRPEHGAFESVNGDPFVIQGPGEYEAKGVFVWGHAIDHGTPPRRTTLYVLESEGLTLAHLGDLSVVLTEGQLDRLEGVDILCLPVGGHDVLDAKKAAALLSEIEPRIVIPMYYHQAGLKKDLDPVSKFAKELGLTPETVEKLKITKKDLPQEETKLVILES